MGTNILNFAFVFRVEAKVKEGLMFLWDDAIISIGLPAVITQKIPAYSEVIQSF